MTTRYRIAAAAIIVLALVGAWLAAHSSREYAFPSAGFAVSARTPPIFSSRKIETDAGQAELRIWDWDVNTDRVMVIDYPLRKPAAPIALMDECNDETHAEGARLLSKSAITLQGVVGLECLTENDRARVLHHFYARGRRVWQVSTASRSGEPSDRLGIWFLGSFRLLPSSES